MKFPPPTILLPVGIFLVLGARACAQGADVSPFVTPAASGAQGQAPDGTSYELRGITASGDSSRFCIFDPARKASQWVELNEPGHPFLVKSADIPHDTVTILTADGRLLVLVLREAKVASLNQGFSPIPPTALPPGAPPGALAAANMVVAPTPEDNQRRLQAIADEVRRRRLLREQAVQAASQQGGPRPQ